MKRILVLSILSNSMEQNQLFRVMRLALLGEQQEDQ